MTWTYKVDVTPAPGTLDLILAIYRHRGSGRDTEVEVWDGAEWVEQPPGAEVLHIYRIPWIVKREIAEKLYGR